MDSALLPARITVHAANYRTLDRRWNNPRQPADPDTRLYVLEAGAAEMTHHDRHFALRPGWMYIIPSYTAMRYSCADSMTIAWTHFTATLPSGLDLFADLRCEYAVPLADAAYHLALMARLRGQVRRHAAEPENVGTMFAMHGTMLQLLAPILATVDPQREARQHGDLARLQPALDYLHRHLDQPVRIADLADLVSLERTYFCTLFHKRFGLPPGRYHQQQRIQGAARMLRDDRRTLAGIADELGFTDAFHLSRTFKKVTGVTPRAYRQRLANPQP